MMRTARQYAADFIRLKLKRATGFLQCSTDEREFVPQFARPS